MSFGGVGVRLSDAKVDYTPTQKTIAPERYKCKTCRFETLGYKCTHPEEGTELFSKMTEHWCWKPRTKTKTKKREDPIDLA